MTGRSIPALSVFHRIALSTMVMAAVFLAAAPGRADSSATAHDPADFLTGFTGRAIDMMGDKTLSEQGREEAFRRLLSGGFDVDLISRFVLGRYWRRATKAQRREYQELFEDFIVATYARRLSGYSGEVVIVGPIREQNEKKALVASRIERSEGPPIQMDWRLRRKDDAWRVVDIMVEGISMALTQRSEFYAVIANNGGRVESLLVKLREKTGRTKAPSS